MTLQAVFGKYSSPSLDALRRNDNCNISSLNCGNSIIIVLNDSIDKVNNSVMDSERTELERCPPWPRPIPDNKAVSRT